MAKRKKSKKSGKKTAAAKTAKKAGSKSSKAAAKKAKPAPTKKAPAADPAPTADADAVSVHVLGTDDIRYPMYQLGGLTESGAELRGGLLHEMAEEFALELGFADESTMRLRARVVDIARDAAPGVKVEFVGVSGEQRGELRRRLGN